MSPNDTAGSAVKTGNLDFPLKISRSLRLRAFTHLDGLRAVGNLKVTGIFDALPLFVIATLPCAATFGLCSYTPLLARFIVDIYTAARCLFGRPPRELFLKFFQNLSFSVKRCARTHPYRDMKLQFFTSFNLQNFCFEDSKNLCFWGKL